MDTIIFIVGFIVSIMVFWGLFMSMSLQFQRHDSETEAAEAKKV